MSSEGAAVVDAGARSPEEAQPLPEHQSQPTPTAARRRSPSEEGEEQEDAPPLPDEPPPLPAEEPPDDGWEAKWDDYNQAFYFYNRFTQVSQWENPRVPEGSGERIPGTDVEHKPETKPPPAPYQGYNPKIHGDYDPKADYAKFHERPAEEPGNDEVAAAAAAADDYLQQGTFNRFTGKFQAAGLSAELHNDENKSKRQMSAFFDVDKAANSHDGRSLREERARRKLSKKEIREYNEKRKAKKEQKRREFLMS